MRRIYESLSGKLVLLRGNRKETGMNLKIKGLLLLLLPLLCGSVLALSWAKPRGGPSMKMDVPVAAAAATPTPKPPVHCNSNQRCCGARNPDGSCDGQCWPRNRPCP